ncbi:CMGC family protein kinase [Histomonas meleagridis]|uniref:CMGC family protein kinase n=1 Tax=Histomonas meleagridis TaxID=135588 RepID=UPI00355ACD80|nr:CMGC family protein kinase [Histomonas meleagridis]KAH0800130.1 CMGC family protein kinase [Histomonas meleagridis]
MERRKKKGPNRKRHIPEYLPYVSYLKFDECIGHGHFSHVYRGTYHQKEEVAIKLIERGSEYLINNEVKILQTLKGAPHVVQLYEVIEKEETMLVFELLKGIDPNHLFEQFTVNRIRFLIRSVLQALDAAHSLGIVHRDVKLGNILIMHNFTDVKLIDWGCGCFANEDMSSKAGSRHCRPPEMLLGYTNYGYGCDVWAVGVLIFYILTHGDIPWKARSSPQTLIIMSEYFGGNELDRIADQIGIQIDDDIDDEFVDEPIKSLESAFAPELSQIVDEGLVDLMKTLLNIDYTKRPTAKEALNHPFLKDQTNPPTIIK